MNSNKKEEDVTSNEIENNVFSDNSSDESANEQNSNELIENEETNSTDSLQLEKEKYLRLYSEFENFRRRTTKERLDWMQSASKEIIESVLPVIDDMERALSAFEKTESKSAIEGLELIYKKLYGVLEKKGIKPMKSKGELFDPEIHEAVTQFPAPSPDLKGKVIDEVEKGYMLHDKVIRFAKVVVGN
jgi:molecular chaperone GrpE